MDLLYVDYGATRTSMQASFVPFDPRQEPARFSLQWPADSIWLALGEFAGHSGRLHGGGHRAGKPTSNNTITARYGRIRALIYNPKDFKQRSGRLAHCESFVEVDGAHRQRFSKRFVALSPDARALLYWNSPPPSCATIPMTASHIGSLELAKVSARSRDSGRVAASSPTGRLRVYDLASARR